MVAPAVAAALARRAGAAAQRAVEVEWFIDQVHRKISLSMEQRVRLATEYVRDKVVRNISVPVVKTVTASGRTVVTERSKPGEFPRADTTQLMKTLFGFVEETSGGVWDGYCGTNLDYGLFLEISPHLDRSFLLRTFREEYGNVMRILTGPIK